MLTEVSVWGWGWGDLRVQTTHCTTPTVNKVYFYFRPRRDMILFQLLLFLCGAPELTQTILKSPCLERRSATASTGAAPLFPVAILSLSNNYVIKCGTYQFNSMILMFRGSYSFSSTCQLWQTKHPASQNIQSILPVMLEPFIRTVARSSCLSSTTPWSAYLLVRQTE